MGLLRALWKLSSSNLGTTGAMTSPLLNLNTTLGVVGSMLMMVRWWWRYAGRRGGDTWQSQIQILQIQSSGQGSDPPSYPPPPHYWSQSVSGTFSCHLYRHIPLLLHNTRTRGSTIHRNTCKKEHVNNKKIEMFTNLRTDRPKNRNKAAKLII